MGVAMPYAISHEQIGSGLQNTISLFNNCTSENAAALCYNLVLNGKSDWFLPSKAELEKLFLIPNLVGGIDNSAIYWSSTQTNAYSNSWTPLFAYGNCVSCGIGWYEKSQPFKVRAMRYF
jgi:hypothetical protein